MLVLKRKENEKIYIGSDIEVIALRCDERGSTKIGIVAPKSVPIHRDNIKNKKPKKKKKLGGGLFGRNRHVLGL